MVQTVFAFLLALGILIGLHEFGHFWVARKNGVKVLRFCIGFGPIVWRRFDRLGCEYCLACVPLGGYVKMLDAREGPVAANEVAQEFSQKSLRVRLAIFAAGPVINLLFAVFLYWVLFLPGETQVLPVVGAVVPESLAAEGRVEIGDEILQVDGELTGSWQAVLVALARRAGESGQVRLSVRSWAACLQSDLKSDLACEPESRVREHSVPIRDFLKADLDQDMIGALGLVPYRPPTVPKIDSVSAQGAGAQAGVQVGDLLLSAHGQKISEWSEWVDLIRANAHQALPVALLRDGQRREIVLVPGRKVLETGEAIGFVGLGVSRPVYPDFLMREHTFGVWTALVMAVEKTWDWMVLILQSLGKMLVGDLSVKNISGPVTIAQVAGDTASLGLGPFLNFMAYLSVSLGVLNLLPIPLLDGGQMVMAVAAHLKGRPLSEWVERVSFGLGLSVLMLLMALAFYNDFARLF